MPSWRRLAGHGIEHIAREHAAGQRKLQCRDLHLDGITADREPSHYQRESWNWRTCGLVKGGMLYNNLYDPRAPLINAKKVVEASALAFADLPPALRTLLANRYGFGTAGHTVATLAAFCQIAEGFPDAAYFCEVRH